MSYWIVVADGSRARIFSRAKKFSDSNLIETFDHPEGRAHDGELTTDQPGRMSESTSPAQRALRTDVSPKDKEQNDFARQLAGRIDKARTSNKFEHLVLVAAPAFLGKLRGELGQSQNCVVASVDKDLTQSSDADIGNAVDDALRG